MASRSIFLALAVTIRFFIATFAGSFLQDFNIQYGDWRTKISENGQILDLSLDIRSGSGIISKNQYLYAKLDMEIKLIRGNSAGTVATFYMSSLGSVHDEIDFEFLGDVNGEADTLQTNLYVNGRGDREQKVHLWFDPTRDFHTYSILWNPHNIIWAVDGIPIRQFKNLEWKGIPFPKNNPMQILCTLWDGSAWATQGGRVKIDWSLAPFTASYRNFSAEACIRGSSSSCSASSSTQSWLAETLDRAGQAKLKAVQHRFMTYDYCSDVKRFSKGLPPECQKKQN